MNQVISYPGKIGTTSRCTTLFLTIYSDENASKTISVLLRANMGTSFIYMLHANHRDEEPIFKIQNVSE